MVPADPQEDRSKTQVTRRVALGGGAAGVAAALLAACGGSSNATGTTVTVPPAAAPVFGDQTGLRFTVVNHLSQSTVFTPTQNGVQDACQLLGCSFEWAGSETGDVAAMLTAIDTAVSAKVDGIATTIIDREAFSAPVAAALAAGIPVVTYNSDAGHSPRLAYIGSDAVTGGKQMGHRVRALLPAGGEIAVFLSTPGISNLGARLAGLRSALHGGGFKIRVVASGSTAGEQASAIGHYVSAHPHLDGAFALDGGSTAALATALQGSSMPHIAAGGYDLTPTTQQLLTSGVLDFAIDEQLYLQGFLPVLELYLHSVSDGLTGLADVDTGARFIDPHLAATYQKTQSRFEGTSTSPGLQGG